jgi:hypothetical protein
MKVVDSTTYPDPLVRSEPHCRELNHYQLLTYFHGARTSLLTECTQTPHAGLESNQE